VAPKRKRQPTSGGSVALVLAISLAIAFNVFTLAVLYTAIQNETALSENATQVLTGWGGGIIGILGAYIGYRLGRTPDEDVEESVRSPGDTFRREE
jgi:hypothetical protein